MIKLNFSHRFFELMKNNNTLASLCLSQDIFRLRIYNQRGYVIYTLTLWYISCKRESWQLYKGHKKIIGRHGQ
jgi:hypothetical protein